MNTKLLASMAVLAIAAAGTTFGTFAFLSDTEASTENIFTAGDLDLTLDGLNGVTATIVGANLAPGDSTSGSVVLRNQGSIYTGDVQGHIVDLDFEAVIVTTDDLGSADRDDGGFSNAPFGQYLQMTSFTYGGTSLLGLIGDLDGDGRANTLSDLEARGVFKDLVDPLASGKTLSMSVTFLPSGPNYLKRDVVEISFKFHLAQNIAPDLTPSLVFISRFTSGVEGAWTVIGTSPLTATSPNGEKFFGNYGNRQATLTLAGLPTHTSATVKFDFYAIRSWDGSGVSGPDRFLLKQGTTTLIDTTFANMGQIQCYPSNCPASNPTKTGALPSAARLGFSSSDSVYTIARTFSHTSGTLTLMFHGWTNQPGTDESWGLDNIRVTTHK